MRYELEEKTRCIEELEFREKKREEGSSEAAIRQREKEIENLEDKCLGLHEAKKKMTREINELKDALHVSEQREAGLFKENDLLRKELQSAPQEYYERLVRANEDIKTYQKELNKFREENTNLEEEVMTLRNQTNSHFYKKSAIVDHFAGPKGKEGREEYKPQAAWITTEGAMILAEEIRSLLKVQTGTEILDGIKKMNQIIKAIPKMEGFIKGVCDIVFQVKGEDGYKPEVTINFS